MTETQCSNKYQKTDTVRDLGGPQERHRSVEKITIRSGRNMRRTVTNDVGNSFSEKILAKRQWEIRPTLVGKS